MSSPLQQKQLRPTFDMKRFVTISASLFLFMVIATWLISLFNPALAQALTLDLGPDAENGSVTGRLIQIVAVMTILSLAPSILIMMTSFTRIIVVLSFLRTAMGIQQTPPNTVLISLALFLTFFIMSPTIQRAYVDGVEPLVREELTKSPPLNAPHSLLKSSWPFTCVKMICYCSLILQRSKTRKHWTIFMQPLFRLS